MMGQKKKREGCEGGKVGCREKQHLETSKIKLIIILLNGFFALSA